MSEKRLRQQQLIFGGNSIALDTTLDDDAVEELEIDDERYHGQRRPSAYVLAFEQMVEIVVGCEEHLLSFEEIEILSKFSCLCYNARYCLVKLILRKVNQWHPILALKAFEKEVSEEGLTMAVQDLCKPIAELFGVVVKAENVDDKPSLDSTAIVKEEPDLKPTLPGPSNQIKREESIIDLSMTDDEDVKPNISQTPSLTPGTSHILDSAWSRRPGPSRQEDPIRDVLETDPSISDLSFFCETEAAMSTIEILERLNKDQLMAMAKEMKCKLKPSAKKEEIITRMQTQASGQQVLSFCTQSSKGKGKGKARDGGLRQTNLAKFGSKPPPKQTQEERLRQMAMKRLGPCIRVNYDFYRLVRRLHLICFRSTEHPTDLLIPALLPMFKKREYPKYLHNRTNDVWSSRQELLEYEQALELNSLLDEIIDEQPTPNSKRATKTPSVAPRRRSFATPGAPDAARMPTTPLKTPGSIGNRHSATPLPTWDGDPVQDDRHDEQDSSKLSKHKKIEEHFKDWIYPTWLSYVADSERGVRQRHIGLERFDAGYVYTRMVHKSIKSFGPLKEYAKEKEVLDALLAQRIWCRGKRGKWRTRRAVVFGHLTRLEKTLEAKTDLKWDCLQALKDALLDADTGIVYRPNLVDRLQKLEKALKVPPEHLTVCEGKLQEPPAERIYATRAEPLKLDKFGRPIGEKENAPDIAKHFQGPNAANEEATEPKVPKRTGKSTWKGRNGEIVNVETRALEEYEDKGFKGFHCETTLLKAIFGLLFWDIIFADVPGAFDTPYQICPLDMFHDSFLRARSRLIEERCKELRQGLASEIMRRHDKGNREKTVLNVAVNWEFCSQEDLLEIIKCFTGETLAMICQIFCEDFEGRSSGGPDLFVWNADERRCKFVEVKGPGDRPQENQKFWFDSLQRAGADVEICWVIDADAPKRPKVTGGKRKRSMSAPGKVKDPESEEEDYDRLDVGHEDEEVNSSPSKKRRILAPGGLPSAV